jgi:divalent metal cation (Fe/Co/Zn/Cd) transporter
LVPAITVPGRIILPCNAINPVLATNDGIWKVDPDHRLRRNYYCICPAFVSTGSKRPEIVLKDISWRKVDSDQRYSETRRVTLIGAVIDLVLGIAKILIGIVGHSHGLVADGVHSLSDLVTDGLVIWAAKYGNQEADAEHPYGHERIQTISTVLLGLALIIVALLIAYDAVMRLLSSESMEVPGNLTLAVASISILAKEWIYRYTMRVARRIRSRLLTANAWHSRSDATTSIRWLRSWLQR